MEDEFSPTETKALSRFFTNLSQPVFGLRLPQEVAGALFSRYSRSSKSLRRVFMDEFLGNPDLGIKTLLESEPEYREDIFALKKARSFYERLLVGYGDDSVAQLAGAHIACEDISNVASKILEDCRIGIAPLEKSTRYVRFDRTDESGEYRFYKEPSIMNSAHSARFQEVMNLLFGTYSKQMDPMINFVRNSFPIESMEFRHPETGVSLTFNDVAADDHLKEWAERAYRSTVRAHACDVLRSYLPADTLTNVGLFGNGQAFEYLLTKLHSHRLHEPRNLADSIKQELEKLIPSLIRRGAFSEYIAGTYDAIRTLTTNTLRGVQRARADAVLLVDFDADAEEKVIVAILYPHSEHPLGQIRGIVAHMPIEKRNLILEEYVKRRRHRRDKPGRALEQAYYTFDVLANLGVYRDLQRHRILTQERQDFTTFYGYDIPDEIEAAGFKQEFDRCMEKAANLYETLYSVIPESAQYVVPFAFRVRWMMKLNLREAVHIGELRTLPQGHPDYRAIVQEMWRQITAVHPNFSQCAKFINWGTYRLGRLHSEVRTEYKKDLLRESED